MGIKNLNRFFKDNASSSINSINLEELAGKKIAVDINIYMHKYVSENSLIENMYLMLSVFRYYNITPVFIFDGKPPDEKKGLIIKRRAEKLGAIEGYENIKNILLNSSHMDDNDKKELIHNMATLKRTSSSLKSNDIENVKNLLRAHGATYYDAQGEADELCAMLTICGKVWACLSEDMDLFVYGCPRVIRYLSLFSHTAVLYDLDGILKNLGLSQKQLREICILSGTDYNSNSECKDKTEDLYVTLNYFQCYYNDNKKIEFYDWLIENTDYIKDYGLLIKINKMFDLNNNMNIKIFENINIMNGPIQKNMIEEILKNDGFVFAPNN
jgi:flap endonuclease-1